MTVDSLPMKVVPTFPLFQTGFNAPESRFEKTATWNSTPPGPKVLRWFWGSTNFVFRSVPVNAASGVDSLRFGVPDTVGPVSCFVTLTDSVGRALADTVRFDVRPIPAPAPARIPGENGVEAWVRPVKVRLQRLP